MTIGNRIKKIRGELTQKEFGEQIGASQSAIQKWESDSAVPGFRNISAIQNKFKIRAEWLLTGEGDPYLSRAGAGPTVPPPEDMEDNNFIYNEAHAEDVEIPTRKEPDDFSEFRLVPLAEAFLSAGGGAFVLSENMKENYAFRRDWLRKISTSADNLVLMRVRGMSMEPTIQPGDMVLIDKGRKRVHDGYIYAIGLDETIVIKRLAPLPGSHILVISDNPDKHLYETREYFINEIRIIGQVIWYGRELVKGEE